MDRHIDIGGSRFRLGADAIPDADVRAGLQQAVLSEDAKSFREILERALPEIAGQHRLYGVFLMSPGGMQTVIVDETGERIGPGFVIAAYTPMTMLNLEVDGTTMTVTTPEGEIWRVPIPPQSP